MFQDARIHTENIAALICSVDRRFLNLARYLNTVSVRWLNAKTPIARSDYHGGTFMSVKAGTNSLFGPPELPQLCDTNIAGTKVAGMGLFFEHLAEIYDVHQTHIGLQRSPQCSAGIGV
jgi:hypothetical protein